MYSGGESGCDGPTSGAQGDFRNPLIFIIYQKLLYPFSRSNCTTRYRFIKELNDFYWTQFFDRKIVHSKC